MPRISITFVTFQWCALKQVTHYGNCSSLINFGSHELKQKCIQRLSMPLLARDQTELLRSILAVFPWMELRSNLFSIILGLLWTHNLALICKIHVFCFILFDALFYEVQTFIYENYVLLCLLQPPAL